MVGDQGHHDGGLLVGIEIGPVQCHHDGVACADDVGHPANQDIVDVDHRVGEQAIDLFRGMLGVQATCGGEALTDHADRKRRAAQHAEGSIAERVDALGVKILVQHAAQDLSNMIEGEPLLPDDHRNPDSALPTGRLAGWGGAGNRLGDFARMCHRWRSLDSFGIAPTAA